MALGSGALANRSGGSKGYDVLTGNATTEASAAWVANANAIAIGNDTEGSLLTRQIILTRQWVSDSQGLFLRQDTPGAQGGGAFYTDLLPTERGVMQRFTPSMVTKQLSLYSYRQNLYRFRLAGIAPMNPENRLDDFEMEAIRSFAQTGSQEYYALDRGDGDAVFHYSAPSSSKRPACPATRTTPAGPSAAV